MRLRTYIVVLIALLLLGACGQVETGAVSGQQPASPQPSPNATATVVPPITATPAPQPTPHATETANHNAAATPITMSVATATTTAMTETVPLPSPRPAIYEVVRYRKSGGFAGINETLTVYSNGNVELITRNKLTRQIQITPTDLAALQQLLASSDFATVQSPAQPPAADAFVYEITIPSSTGKGRVITSTDGAQNPAALNSVLDALGRLRSQFG